VPPRPTSAGKGGVAIVPALFRALLGPPLPTSAERHERLSIPRALGAFGLDALSSVAYGPDEILYVLLPAGAAALRWSFPIALAIAALLAIVVTSYRQTIFAYPNGGGSYTVARENLGVGVGLLAAAALMVDYLTTVAVSVTSGVQQISAFVPAVYTYRVPICVACVGLLMLANLRGLREAGGLFVLPTYAFLGSLGVVVAWGLVQLVTGHLHPLPPQAVPAATESLSLVLILRAFAGGCTAMTGVEAIANGVPVFEEPRTKTAARTLVLLGVCLGVLFLGVAGLGSRIGAVPTSQQGVLAQVGLAVAGQGPLFYLVQISAATILILAANTSFNGFPLLAALMARDDYLPHQFVHRGLRLAYSAGILVLGSLAIVLIVAFGGDTHALIPLFAVGVFLCFTLSQVGMVRHWRTEQGPRWRTKLAINGFGALTTGVVTLIVVASKFTEGAWIVVLLVPAIVWLLRGVHAHYALAERQLRLERFPRGVIQREQVLIPVRAIDRTVAAAIIYGRAISTNVVAVHVAVDPDYAEQLRARWQEWECDVPLEIIPSPYREVIAPLLSYIEAAARADRSVMLTVLLPQIITRHWWQEVLHNQTAVQLSLALRGMPNLVVTAVPIKLEE
jgi:amino acid transporter